MWAGGVTVPPWASGVLLPPLPPTLLLRGAEGTGGVLVVLLLTPDEARPEAALVMLLTAISRCSGTCDSGGDCGCGEVPNGGGGGSCGGRGTEVSGAAEFAGGVT